MIERIVVVLVLAILAVVAYRVFTRCHIRSAGVDCDPILRGLKRDTPTIVYFSTPMCLPCKTQQQPALQRVKAELGDGVQVVWIDATQNAEAAERWRVFSVPTTFILDRNGKPREVNYGVADADKLKRQLQAASA